MKNEYLIVKKGTTLNLLKIESEKFIEGVFANTKDFNDFCENHYKNNNLVILKKIDIDGKIWFIKRLRNNKR